jgi:hypothetical protein
MTMRARQATLIRWLGGLIALAVLSAQAESPALEYQVKASYLYNFLQFVQWPDESFIDAKFRICVMGAERFGAALDSLNGERVTGREVVVVRVDELPKKGGGCQVLYVAGTAPIDVVTERGLLTIGESPGFLARGGVINLVQVGGRVRFEINQDAAQRARLSLSSHLLKLALKAP